jgi:hypothetical protein
VTKEQLDEIHGALDRATQAANDLSDARVSRDEAAAKDALGRLFQELGATKRALRGVRADQ